LKKMHVFWGAMRGYVTHVEMSYLNL